MTHSTSASLARHWALESACPADWWVRLQCCAGGFFHSPLGLRAGAPEGAPIYATLRQGGEVLGVAAGVRFRCRLSCEARHAYFPTMPALVEPEWRDESLEVLAGDLREFGLADVRFDSFDAPVWSALGKRATRQEYVIPLTPGRDGAMPRCSDHHRRHINRGEREQWALEILRGDAAAIALEDVMGLAGKRATERGAGFDPLVPPLAGDPPIDAPWGSTTFAARRGQSLLAAALVGWCNGRAFYISGGATEAGYAAGASAWLHWRIQQRLISDGFATYNLGGAPTTAIQPEDPSHGLHRFKMGFGAEIVGCVGTAWTLRPVHAEGHEMLRWAAGLWQ
ncbi:MAG: GNAT family N-acetyltransferase [Gemmatimonadales bacterium]